MAPSLEKTAGRPKPDPGRPGPGAPKPGRLGRKIVKIVLAVLLAAILALAGAVLWLRTDSGLAWLLGEAAGRLSATGLSASWESATGPIPGRLILSGVRLEDAGGEFASVDRLELRLSPRRLLDRVLQIDALDVTGLDLARPPRLPSGAAKDDGSGGSPDFGLSIRLSVQDSRVSPAVLLAGAAARPASPDPASPSPPSPDRPSPDQSSPDQSSPGPSSPAPTAAAFQAAPASSPAPAASAPSPDAYGPDRGRTRLTAAVEYHRGVLGFDFDFEWRDDSGPDGPASFVLAPPGAPDPRGPDGSGAPGAGEDARPVPARPAPFRGLAAKGSLTQGDAGRPDRLELSASAHDGPGGTLSLLLGRPDWPAWTLRLDGSGPLTAWTGRAALGLDEDPEGLATASLEIGLAEGSIQKDLVVGRRGRLGLEVAAGPQAPLPEEVSSRLGRGLTLRADLALDGTAASGEAWLTAPNARLSIRNLEAAFESPRWRLSANGSLAFDPAAFVPGALAAGSSAPSAPGPPAPASPEGGDAAPAASPGTGTAAAASPGAPAGPSPASPGAAAPTAVPDADAPLQGPQAGVLAAGYSVKASGEGAEARLESLTLSGEGLELSASGDVAADSAARAAARLAIAAGSPWMGLAAVPEGRRTGGAGLDATLSRAADGRLDATVKLSVDELGVAGPWRGALTADAAASGPPENLDVELDLASPELTGPTGRAFRDFSAKASVRVESPPSPAGRGDAGGSSGASAGSGAGSAALRLSGDLKASVVEELGGLVALSTGFVLSPGPPLAASVSDLRLTAEDGRRLDLASPALSFAAGSPPSVEGSLSLAVNDWGIVEELTGIPARGEPAGLTLSAGPDPEAAAGAAGRPSSAEARLSLPKLEIASASLSAVELSLSAKGLPSDPSLDLELSMGPGRAGGLAFGSARIRASGPGPRGTVEARLADPEGGHLAELSGDYDLESSSATIGSLSAQVPGLPGRIELKGPAAVGWAPVTVSGLRLAFGADAAIEADAALSPARARVKVENLALSDLRGFWSDAPEGRASLSADWDQATGQGRVDLRASVSPPASIEGLPAEIEVAAAGRLEEGGRRLAGTVSLSPGRGGQVDLKYRLPMAVKDGWPAPDPGGDVSAELAWRGDVTPLWSLAGLADQRLTGTLDLSLKVAGPLSRLRPDLRLYLAGGAFEDPANGLHLSGINLELTDTGDRTLRLLAEAGDRRGGRIALEGEVRPFDSPPTLEIRGQLTNLSPLHRDDADLTLTALARIAGPLASPTVTAKAVVNAADINLDNVRSGSASIRTLPVEGSMARVPAGPLLDVTIDIPRQTFIRGKGLDSEWAGSLVVTGRATRPLISGTLKPIRGTFDLLSKQFALSGGDIQFINSPTLNPVLNLEMTRSTPELVAKVEVGGRVSQPRIQLSSQPPHPSDEVLSQVLFGKNVSQLSRLEALQLANSLRVMAGLGGHIGLNILNNLRDTLGLSVLRVSDGSSGGSQSRYLGGNSFRDNLGLDTDAAPSNQESASIEAGRYLSDNVYVGLEQNLVDNSTGVRVEVELTPSLTLQGLSSSTSSRVGLGWKRDY